MSQRDCAPWVTAAPAPRRASCDARLWVRARTARAVFMRHENTAGALAQREGAGRAVDGDDVGVVRGERPVRAWILDRPEVTPLTLPRATVVPVAVASPPVR